MADIAKLKTEIDTDPLGRGYAGMTDAQVADSGNVADREVNKTSMAATEVLNTVVVAEYNALTTDNKTLFWNVLAIGDLNPFGIEAALLTSIFGSGSATIIALAAKRKHLVTRWAEIGAGVTYAGDIAQARAL